MRRFRRITALLLVIAALVTSACAEVDFLQHAAEWSLTAVPVEVQLSADVMTHMPYDDDRLAMLKQITDVLRLKLITGQDEGSVTVYVGNSEALTLAYLDNAVQLSCIPDYGFTTSDDPLGMLLGSGTSDMSLYSLSGDKEALLDDGWTLLNAVSPAFDDYADRRNVKTSITDMGTARSCTDYTIPQSKTEEMKTLLLSLCPAGELYGIIENLEFSGRQTLRVYRTADELPLRMEYNGNCGIAGNMRKVKLVWRMRRDDVAYRDEISLTSPAVSGTNKNNLEFSRVLSTGKDGVIELEGSFTYTVTAEKQTTTTKGEFELSNACTADSDVITGTATFQQKGPEDEYYNGLSFEPDVTISGSADEPVISGSVLVSGLYGKNTVEQARLAVSLKRSEDSMWESREEMIDLDALTDDQLQSLRESVSSSIATAIVRPLIILLNDSAEWFFREMPQDAVDGVVDAAGSVLIVE